MRKIAAIILLLVFLFNLIGYKFLFDYLQHRNDQAFQTAIDRDQYNESELVTVRVPLSMPYQPENTPFERLSGEVTVGNVIYKYVKRRIENGDLVLLCLPDKKKTELTSGKDAFFRLANEFQQFNNTKHQDGRTSTIFKLSVFPLSGNIDFTAQNFKETTKCTDTYLCLFPTPLPLSIDLPPDLEA